METKLMTVQAYKNQKQWKEDLLICGFNRINFHKFVPLDISRLCNQYFEVCLKLLTVAATLKLNNSDTNHNKVTKKVPIDLYEIIFECQLTISNDKTFKFTVELVSLPKEYAEIKSFTIYYEIFSNTNNKLYKGLKVNKSRYVYSMEGKCKSTKCVSVTIGLDLFNIKYNLQKFRNEKTFFKNITMNKHIRYDWIIEGNVMNIFKYAIAKEKFFSSNFGLDGTEINGDNFAWCLYCQPGGVGSEFWHRPYGCDDIGFGLMLLNLPINVGMVAVNCVLFCDYKNYVCTQNRYLSHVDNVVSWEGFVKFDKNDLCKLSTLKFSVIINVLNWNVLAQKMKIIDDTWNLFSEISPINMVQ